MSESFFGFDTGLSTLGAGKPNEFDNELLEAPEDEEIDLLNDETFGDVAAGGDWEAQHEKLAVELEGVHGNGHGYNDSHVRFHGDYGAFNGSSMMIGQQPEGRGPSPDNDLEQSLSQLVVDDEEMDEDAAALIASRARARPIPQNRKPVNLDNLFGPSSPPSFLNAEDLIGGHQNIWGSPVRDGYLPKQQQQQEQGLQTLLMQLQQDKRPPSTMLQDPSIVVASKTMSTGLPEAKTVAEIEKDLMAAGDPGRARRRPMTLEELERHMMGPSGSGGPGGGGGGGVSQQRSQSAMHGPEHHPRKVPSPPQPGFPLPIGTPPRGHFLQQQPSMPVSMPNQSPRPVWRGTPPPLPPQQGSPGMQGRSPLVRGGPPTHGIASPVAMLHRHSPGIGPGPHRISPETHLGLRSPSPSELMMVRSPSPIPLPPQTLARLQAALSPSVLRACMGTECSPPLGALHHHLMGRQSELSSSPLGRMQGPPPQPGIHPRDRCSPPPFHGHMPGPQGNQRMPFPQSHPDQLRNPRGGPPPFRGPGANVRQPMFNSQNRGRFLGPGPGYPPGPHPYNRQNREGPERGGYDPRHRGYQHQQHNNYNNQRFHQRNRYDSFGDEDEDPERMNEDRDEYAGLMTKKEKDWIIKIQLMQLQTDNPYLDDYYYTTWSMKKMAQERKRREQIQPEGQKSGNSDPKLVIPQLSRMENRAYRPVQFENSLGRVTASSVHNPRRIIDIKIQHGQDAEDIKAKERKRFQEILIDIEMGYDLLLDVDDLEKKARGLPADARKPLLDERRNKITKMLHILLLGQPSRGIAFVHYVSIRKGVQLVSRLLSLLPQVDGCTVVGTLLQHLTIISKKDWQTEVLPLVYDTMCQIICLADFESLIGFTEALTDSMDPSNTKNQTNHLLTALKNKFGASVIWSMVSRGEVIYATESPVDLDIEHQQAWSHFVCQLMQAVALLSKDTLAVPADCHPTLCQHLQKLVDKRSFLDVEDKLRLLLSQQPPSAPPVS